MLASVLAAQSIGQEYRFGLIRLTLTAFPDRAQILVAKLVVVVGAALVVTAGVLRRQRDRRHAARAPDTARTT